jgi:hypothetical protein
MLQSFLRLTTHVATGHGSHRPHRTSDLPLLPAQYRAASVQPSLMSSSARPLRTRRWSFRLHASTLVYYGRPVARYAARPLLVVTSCALALGCGSSHNACSLRDSSTRCSVCLSGDLERWSTDPRSPAFSVCVPFPPKASALYIHKLPRPNPTQTIAGHDPTLVAERTDLR